MSPPPETRTASPAGSRAETRAAAHDWSVYRIGLTGGIGSGKSVVAELFASLGIPIIDTDVIAREVVAPGSPGLRAVVDAFGTRVLNADGVLDRRHLRELAFGTPECRQRLEAILHPLIVARLEDLSRAAGGPYQILVVPLLIESGLADRVDRVLVVDCSEEVQRERLMVRDGETAAGADRILAAQLDRRSRLDHADDVLENHGSRAELQQQVQALHAMYLTQAGATGAATKTDPGKGGMKGSG